MSQVNTEIYGGYLLDRDVSERMPLSEIDTAWAKKTQPIWVHLDARNDTHVKWLQKHSGLNEDFVEHLLQEKTRPSLIQHNSHENIADGCLLFIRGVNLNKGNEPDDMVSVRLYITKNKLITLTRRNVFAVHDVIEHVRTETSTVHSCVLSMLENITDRMGDTLNMIEDRLNDLLEHALDDQDPKMAAKELKKLRRYTINLRRFLRPQAEALSDLYDTPQGFHHDEKHRLQLYQNKTMRYIELLDAAWEQSQLTQEQFEMQSNSRMNQIVFILTVLSGVFLPLNFIVGFFGANVGGLPFIENPQGFFYMVGILCASLVFTLLALRKFKWI